MAALIYVCNFNAHSVVAFALGADGDAAPLRAIRGPRTGLAHPIGLAVDARHRLHVANRAPGAGVTVYAPFADGDAPPLRTLSAGAAYSAQAVAIGAAGDVFVAGSIGGVPDGDASILHFPADATCCDAVIAGPRTGLTYPVGLGVAEDGSLLVANGFGGVVSALATNVFGDVRPLRSFTAAGGNTRALACGARTLLVGGDCLCLYPVHADAGAKPAAVFGRSPRLRLRDPGGVAIGAGVAPPVLAMTDFAAGAVHVIRTAGAAPALRIATVRTICGTATGLDGPTGVLIGDRRVPLAIA